MSAIMLNVLQMQYQAMLLTTLCTDLLEREKVLSRHQQTLKVWALTLPHYLSSLMTLSMGWQSSNNLRQHNTSPTQITSKAMCINICPICQIINMYHVNRGFNWTMGMMSSIQIQNVILLNLWAHRQMLCSKMRFIRLLIQLLSEPHEKFCVKKLNGHTYNYI